MNSYVLKEAKSSTFWGHKLQTILLHRVRIFEDGSTTSPLLTDRNEYDLLR